MSAFAPPVPPPGRHHVCLSASLACSGSNPCVLCRECTEQNVIGRAYELARLPFAQIQSFRDSLAQAWVEFAHDSQTDPLFRERTLDLERAIICESLEEAAAVKAWLEERRRVRSVPVPPAREFVAVQSGGVGAGGQIPIGETVVTTIASTSVELPNTMGAATTLVGGGVQHAVQTDGANLEVRPIEPPPPAATEAYTRESALKPEPEMAVEEPRPVPRLSPDERVRPLTAREVASHLRPVEAIDPANGHGAADGDGGEDFPSASAPADGESAELLNGAASAEPTLE